ncbi:MAG TPA: chemotaxis protein CheB, partial [Chitinophagaceae bacterium]|nr:chemotaxis protein CheB [Chitinophagaceae bacterium]
MKRKNFTGKKKAGKKAGAAKDDGTKKHPKKVSGRENHEKELRHPEKAKPMPVVGIGSSAGGLEAFSKFLESLPPNLGMAYVYVQHLSPDHESLLPEILERRTKMPVMKTEQDMQIKKDHVYVIPANKFITISDGTFKLQPRTGKENFYPIDSFFISLANTYQENAIGILLSGTGTDGTLGLKGLKAEGGITFAQDDSARYHDMPHHATEMGYVDFIMPP